MTAFSQIVTADTVINGSAPTTNYGTSAYLQIGGLSGFQNRGLIINDLLAVPSNATIVDPVLHAYFYNGYENTFAIYRLKLPWTAGGATWNKYDGTHDWNTAGAMGANDYDSNSLGSLACTGAAGWKTTSLSAALLLSICGLSPSFGGNWGLLLKGAETTNTLCNVLSSQSADYEPYLTFEWTPPAGEGVSDMSNGMMRLFKRHAEKIKKYWPGWRFEKGIFQPGNLGLSF